MTDTSEVGVSRREVVKGAGAAAIGLAAATWPLSHSLAADGQTVTGIVFEDRSHAGQRQAGDPGIAGVLVSNGRDVAKTDAEGRYTLPIEEGMVIFVIKPSGYAVPVDDEQAAALLPHPPAEGLARRASICISAASTPTGPLPASVDFALRKSEEAIELRRHLVHRSAARKRCRGELHP